MSWQCTAWAAKQKTGSAARKVLLLVLANYADEHGICWPTQETLKLETELSEDTIQRHSKALERDGLLKMSRRRRKTGTWAGKIYQLNMRVVTMPQNAVWSDDEKPPTCEPTSGASTTPQPAADHTATTGETTPQALRHKPSLNKPSSSKPSSSSSTRKPVAARLEAFHGKQVGIEVIQNLIASRLGPDGWLILQSVSASDLTMLTRMQQANRLSDAELEQFRMLWKQRGAA
jgi:DNA-binding transcriptional ArsR family regulator